MTGLLILEDHQAEVIGGGSGPAMPMPTPQTPSFSYISTTSSWTKLINKVKYDQVNSLQNNVGATILDRGAVLAASITSTQLNSIGGK